MAFCVWREGFVGNSRTVASNSAAHGERGGTVGDGSGGVAGKHAHAARRANAYPGFRILVLAAANGYATANGHAAADNRAAPNGYAAADGHAPANGYNPTYAASYGHAPANGYAGFYSYAPTNGYAADARRHCQQLR